VAHFRAPGLSKSEKKKIRTGYLFRGREREGRQRKLSQAGNSTRRKTAPIRHETLPNESRRLQSLTCCVCEGPRREKGRSVGIEGLLAAKICSLMLPRALQRLRPEHVNDATEQTQKRGKNKGLKARKEGTSVGDFPAWEAGSYWLRPKGERFKKSELTTAGWHRARRSQKETFYKQKRKKRTSGTRHPARGKHDKYTYR